MQSRRRNNGKTCSLGLRRISARLPRFFTTRLCTSAVDSVYKVKKECAPCVQGKFLDGGQTVQRFHHSLVGQLQGLFNALALDQLGGHAGGGNGGAAAEGQELHVLDDAVFDLQVHTHDVAALGVAHFAHAVGVRQFAHIAGMGEMIHNFFTIHACHVETLLCWFKSRGGANAEPPPGGKGHCPKCFRSEATCSSWRGGGG